MLGMRPVQSIVGSELEKVVKDHKSLLDMKYLDPEDGSHKVAIVETRGGGGERTRRVLDLMGWLAALRDMFRRPEADILRLSSLPHRLPAS